MINTDPLTTGQAYREQLKLLLGKQLSAEQSNQVYSLLREWAKNDLRNVHDWVIEQEGTPQFSNYFAFIVELYMEHDLAEAGDIILNMADESTQTPLIQQYVYRSAQLDPTLALDWSHGILNQDQRVDAQLTLLRIWAESRPQAVFESISILPELKPHHLKEIVIAASRSISHEDPALFAGNLYQYPQALQAEVAYGVAGNWTLKDSFGALSWIETLDNNLVKDRAITAFADNSKTTDLGDAFTLAKQVSNQDLRAILLTRVAKKWLLEQPDAAREALRSSDDLNEDSKQAIFQSIEKSDFR